MEENIVTQPEVAEVTTQETTQETQPIQETPKESQSFKVKHLHEEKEISYEEAPTYIQKGLDYDRVKARYEDSKPVIGFVEKLAQQNNMTVPEYLKAVDEYQRQTEIETLAQQRNLDPELAEELHMLRQERLTQKQQKQQAEEEARKNQEFTDFVKEFPDVDSNTIPQEVWILKYEKGLSVTDAYIRHEHNKMKQQLKAQEVNSQNAESSTGSVTGNGSNDTSYINFETFQKNRTNKDWIQKNYNKIVESRSKW